MKSAIVLMIVLGAQILRAQPMPDDENVDYRSYPLGRIGFGSNSDGSGESRCWQAGANVADYLRFIQPAIGRLIFRYECREVNEKYYPGLTGYVYELQADFLTNLPKGEYQSPVLCVNPYFVTSITRYLGFMSNKMIIMGVDEAGGGCTDHRVARKVWVIIQ